MEIRVNDNLGEVPKTIYFEQVLRAVLKSMNEDRKDAGIVFNKFREIFSMLGGCEDSDEKIQLFLEHSELFKSVFMKIQGFLLCCGAVDWLDQNFQQLLKMFLEVDGNQDFDSFCNLLILILVEQGLFFSRQSGMLLEYLKKCLDSKQELRDICIVPIVFCREIIVTEFLQDENWMAIWNRLTKIMDADEISAQIIISIKKLEVDTTFNNFHQFLSLCVENYQEIITGLAKHGVIECLLEMIDKKKLQNFDVSDLINCITQVIKYPETIKSQVKILKLYFDGRLKHEKLLRREFYQYIPLGIQSSSSEEITDFFSNLHNETELKIVNLVLKSFNSVFSEKVQKHLMDKKIFYILRSSIKTCVKNSSQGAVQEFWVYFFRLLHYFNDIRVLHLDKDLKMIILELRKDAYKNCRQQILSESFQYIRQLYSLSRDFFWMLLEFLSYSVLTEKFEENLSILNDFKLKDHNFKHASIIEEAILHHLPEISDKNWPVYSKILTKCLKFKVSCNIIKKIADMTFKLKSRLNIRVLECIRASIDTICLKSNIIKEFSYYSENSYFEVYNIEGLIACKNEFSIALWFKPSKSCKNCCLVEISDGNITKLFISLKNSKISLKGITSKTVFEADSAQEVLYTGWNLLQINTSLRNKQEIIINLNCEVTKTIFQSKFNFDVVFTSLVLGSFSNKSERFKGKLGSVQIYKRTLASEEIKAIYSYIKVNPINAKIFKEPSIISRLKSELIFYFSGIELDTTMLAKSNAFINLYQVCKCKGKSWYDAFKCINGIDGMKINNSEEFSIMLDVFSQLFKLSDVNDIIPQYFAETVVCRAITFSISVDVKKKFLRFIFSVKSNTLAEKLLFYFLNETCLHSFKNTSGVEDADQLVFLFKKFYQAKPEYFLLLSRAFSGMEIMNINYVLRHFIEDFCDRQKITKILEILIKSEDFTFIESIILLIEGCDFESSSEDFLSILLMLLTHPLSIPFQSSLTKMIYKEINSKFDKSSKKSSKAAEEALRFIKDRFTGIEALIECISHYGLKSSLFNAELKQSFLDIVLIKTRYSENPQSIQKLSNFLAENSHCLHSFVYLRNIFPYWLCDLYKKQPAYCISLAETLLCNLSNYEDLTKIDYFFRNVKSGPDTLELYEKFLCKFVDSIYCKNCEKLAEVVLIFDVFKLKKATCTKYFNVFQYILDVYSTNYFLLVNPTIKGEYSAVPSKHILRVLLKLSLQMILIDGKFTVNLKRILMLTKYFEAFGSQVLDGKIVENHLVLYTFCVLCEIIYSKKVDVQEFFKEFLVRSAIKQRLSIFFNSLSDEDLNKCTDLIQNNNFNSSGKLYLDSIIDKKKFHINPDIRNSLINAFNHPNSIEIIYSSDWINQIHYILIILIVLPIKSTNYRPKPIQPRDPELEANSNPLKQFEEILAKVTLEDLKTEKEMKKNFIKTINAIKTKEQSLKIDNIEGMLDGKFLIKNRVDKMPRWSLLKLNDKVFELDDRASILLQESMRRSLNLHDIESRIFSSVFQCPVDLNVGFSENKNFIRAEFEQIKISGSFFGIATFSRDFFELKFRGKEKSGAKYIGSALKYTIKRKKKNVVFSVGMVSEVLSRRFIHKNSAIEIYLNSGKSYFLNFFGKSCKEEVLSVVSNWQNVKVISAIPYEQIKIYRDKWNLGQISTLEYLLILNKYSGRSFHDLSQYPIFPWVITNYISSGLNPDDPSIYRDFNYSIGAQTSEKRQELNKKLSLNVDELGKYHYGQHYSNGGIVLYYLFRIEPFLTQMKILQEGKFDHPDRTFFSLECSWECSQMNIGDSKELVPELYYLPQVLQNLNGLSIGENRKFGRDSGEFVLPPWAKNSWDFIRKHRKCLESAHCSSNINNWIDLIFGYKQYGEQAKAACNLFHPISYQEFYKKYLKFMDPADHACIIDQIYHFGQTPYRIFTEPHIKRKFIPKPSIYDSWRTEQGLCNKSIGYCKTGEYLDIIANQEVLIIIFIFLNQIYFSRSEISEKSLGKFKDFPLKQAKISDFCQPIFSLFKSFIVSGGYQDSSLRLSNYEGELILILAHHPSPILCISASEKLYTGSRILLGWDINSPKYQNFTGHKAQIKSISVSDSLNLIISCDTEGNILIHDTKTSNYMHSMKQPTEKLLISDLGFFITFSTQSFKYYTFDGQTIGKLDILLDNSVEINNFGDMLLMIYNGKIVCIDILEESIFEAKIGDFCGFCVSKDEKTVFAVNKFRDQFKIEVFVQNSVKKNRLLSF